MACTKIVLPQVIARGLHLVCYMYSMSSLYVFEDLNITKVAHDYQSAIKRYVEELGMAISMTHGMVWYDHSSTVVMCISWICAGHKECG